MATFTIRTNITAKHTHFFPQIGESTPYVEFCRLNVPRSGEWVGHALGIAGNPTTKSGERDALANFSSLWGDGETHPEWGTFPASSPRKLGMERVWATFGWCRNALAYHLNLLAIDKRPTKMGVDTLHAILSTYAFRFGMYGIPTVGDADVVELAAKIVADTVPLLGDDMTGVVSYPTVDAVDAPTVDAVVDVPTVDAVVDVPTVDAVVDVPTVDAVDAPTVDAVDAVETVTPPDGGMIVADDKPAKKSRKKSHR